MRRFVGTPFLCFLFDYIALSTCVVLVDSGGRWVCSVSVVLGCCHDRTWNGQIVTQTYFWHEEFLSGMTLCPDYRYVGSECVGSGFVLVLIRPPI